MPTVKMTPVPADGWADPITEPSSRQPSRERLVMEIDWLPDTENTYHRESSRIKWMYTPNSLQIALPHPVNISPYVTCFFHRCWLSLCATQLIWVRSRSCCLSSHSSLMRHARFVMLEPMSYQAPFHLRGKVDFLFALSPAGNGRTAFKLILVHQNKRISGSLCNMKSLLRLAMISFYHRLSCFKAF